MKLLGGRPNRSDRQSLPVRGAWIEIDTAAQEEEAHRSLPVRGAWIEIVLVAGQQPPEKSLPVRGAWIEIGLKIRCCWEAGVAPRKGSVD